jgi:hypothetical protein
VNAGLKEMRIAAIDFFDNFPERAVGSRNASVMTVDFRVRCGTRNLQVRRGSDIHSAVMDCELERNDQEPPAFNTKEKYKNRSGMEEG